MDFEPVRGGEGLLLSHLLDDEGRVQLIAEESGLRKDEELALVHGIELSVDELLWFTGELLLRQVELLALIQIENGHLEVRHSTNHEQVGAVPGEGHADALDGGVHRELVDWLFLGVTVDVALWVEAILSGCN